MKGSMLLAGAAVAVSLLPLILLMSLAATFNYDRGDEYAGVKVIGVPLLAAFVCGPLAILTGCGAVLLARRLAPGRRLPFVVAGVAITVGVLEALSFFFVA